MPTQPDPDFIKLPLGATYLAPLRGDEGSKLLPERDLLRTSSDMPITIPAGREIRYQACANQPMWVHGFEIELGPSAGLPPKVKVVSLILAGLEINVGDDVGPGNTIQGGFMRALGSTVELRIGKRPIQIGQSVELVLTHKNADPLTFKGVKLLGEPVAGTRELLGWLPTAAPEPRDEALRTRAVSIHGTTWTTWDYRVAPANEGPLAYDWSDKPHRLVYDLCDMLERICTQANPCQGRQEVDGAAKGNHEAGYSCCSIRRDDDANDDGTPAWVLLNDDRNLVAYIEFCPWCGGRLATDQAEPKEDPK